MYHSGANTALRGVGNLVPDFLELVDRTGLHKQAFDASIWTTPDDDAEGKEVEPHALIGLVKAPVRHENARDTRCCQ